MLYGLLAEGELQNVELQTPPLLSLTRRSTERVRPGKRECFLMHVVSRVEFQRRIFTQRTEALPRQIIQSVSQRRNTIHL